MHPSVVEPARRAWRDGAPGGTLPLDPEGRVVDSALEDVTLGNAPLGDGALVSIHWVNNETGTVQDLARWAERVHAAGGILHTDGVISLGRTEPGTGGGGAFFICIGDQPALDFGETRNPDKLGFAAFGKVIDGMDVVRNIQQRDATAPSDSEYTAGQILAEPVLIKKAYRVPN